MRSKVVGAVVAILTYWFAMASQGKDVIWKSLDEEDRALVAKPIFNESLSEAEHADRSMRHRSSLFHAERYADRAAAPQDAKRQLTNKSESPIEDTQVEEVVVTAQKRGQRLMDVPSSTSAITENRMELLQVDSVAELANYVPGMSVVSMGSPGARNIVLRGLNTNYSNAQVAATVGTYIDDLPIGTSSAAGRGAQYGADLQPYDIERVEVLKGPQGTLYGANTLGGLVKYVLRKPDLGQFQANAGTDLSYVNDSGGADWGLRGMVNIPILADKLGVRISGFRKKGAGYIDDVGLGAKDVNASTQQGGRATILWQVSEIFAVRAGILAQDDDIDSVTGVTMDADSQGPLYGSNVKSTHFLEPYKQTTRNYSLNADWDLGFATLTSASGWSKIAYKRAEDLTVPYGSFCVPGSITPTSAGCVDYPNADALALFAYGGETSKFVEEIRLASPDDQRIQWMLGAFYTKESAEENFNFRTFTPSHVPLSDASSLLIGNYPGAVTYKESAGFANGTYQFNDRFDVSAGVRVSAYRQSTTNNVNSGLIFSDDGGTVATLDNRLPSEEVTTWMINSRYRPSPSAMVYARVATGYRPGRGCKVYSDGTPCGVPQLGIPGFVDPDRTINYELGFKSQLFDQRLQLDAALFYIDWSDIQIQTVNAQGQTYPGNGGTARSQGIEVALSAQPLKGLRFDSTIAYTDAKLTEDAPAVGGESGDALPVSPQWTGSITVDYSRAIDERVSALFGAGYRYRDAIVNQFEHTGFAVPMGPQNLVNLYTGMEINALTLRLSASNVFNDRSYAGLQFINDPTKPMFVPVQPRTIGLSADYRY